MGLAKEVGEIKNIEIKRFVISALLKADLRFWITPASSTNKHHPPEDRGRGGLVRHIKKAAEVAREFSRRARFSEREMDMALAAVLLHDVCKNGIPWGEHTDYTHGLIAAKWLEQFYLPDAAVKEIILDAVRYHMAPWCYAVNPFKDRAYTREEMLANIEELSRALANPSRIETAVQEADYWASRDRISFLPGEKIIVPPQLHDTPEECFKEIIELVE